MQTSFNLALGSARLCSARLGDGEHRAHNSRHRDRLLFTGAALLLGLGAGQIVLFAAFLFLYISP